VSDGLTTDVTKLPVAFRNFTTAPKNQQFNDEWRSDSFFCESDTATTGALTVY